MLAKWYVLHSKPRQEFKAQEELTKQGYEVFLPTLQVQTIAKGQPKFQEQALFSRYLFVRLNQQTDNWGPIRSTKGVANMLQFGKKPASIPDSLLEEIKMWAQVLPQRELFAANQAVEVTKGPFRGFQGIFQKLTQAPDGQMRAFILIEMLGQMTRLELDLPEISRVAA